MVDPHHGHIARRRWRLQRDLGLHHLPEDSGQVVVAVADPIRNADARADIYIISLLERLSES